MIKATVLGYSTVGKNATFAVEIRRNNEVKHQNVITLQSKSYYYAELMAFKYVMLAVVNKNTKLIIETSLKHLPSLFEKNQDGKWLKKPSSNSDYVSELRDLSDKFKSFECVLDLNSERMESVKLLVKNQNATIPAPSKATDRETSILLNSVLAIPDISVKPTT